MKQAALVVVLFVALPTLLICQIDTTKPIEQEMNPVDWEISALGGVSYPYLPAEFPDYWKRGWHASIGYGVSLAPGSIGYGALFATVELNRFDFNTSGYRDSLLNRFPGDRFPIEAQQLQAASISNGSATTFTVMVNFKGSFSSTKQLIAPYFTVGIGYMYFKSDSIAVDTLTRFGIQGESRSTFAWSFDVGIEAPITDSFAAFVQGKSVIGVFDRTRQYFPVSVGVRMKL